MTSLPSRWALVSELTNNEVSPSELAQIAAAVSLQMQRDVAPEWGVVATVQAFPDAKSVPDGFNPAVVVPLEAMPQGALGFHYRSHRRPAAKIGFESVAELGVTVSHELIEAAVDPSGNRLVSGNIVTVGDVEVLVEAADPPEAFSYAVDGVSVSDFVLRSYYGSHRWASKPASTASAGVVTGLASPEPVPAAYSFCKRIDAPLAVARGGYLSFVAADGTWYQRTWFDGDRPSIRSLGRRDEDDPRSHREWVDSLTATVKGYLA